MLPTLSVILAKKNPAFALRALRQGLRGKRVVPVMVSDCAAIVSNHGGQAYHFQCNLGEL